MHKAGNESSMAHTVSSLSRELRGLLRPWIFQKVRLFLQKRMLAVFLWRSPWMDSALSSALWWKCQLKEKHFSRNHDKPECTTRLPCAFARVTDFPCEKEIPLASFTGRKRWDPIFSFCLRNFCWKLMTGEPQ